jgi:hypothetical protein
MEWWDWKQIKLQQQGQEQKLEIKTIMVEVKIPTTTRVKL